MTLLTHCLPQTRRWHLCRPRRCAYCAWKRAERGRVTTVLRMRRSSRWKSVKRHLLICHHVTLRRQTHRTEGVSSSGGPSRRGRSRASGTPRCRSSCGRSQHSGPLWWILRTSSRSPPAGPLLTAAHPRTRPQPWRQLGAAAAMEPGTTWRSHGDLRILQRGRTARLLAMLRGTVSI